MKTENQIDSPAIHCACAELAQIDGLKPNPKNCNQHPPSQIDLLAKNIAALGWRHPVIISKRSGLVVAGHARIEAARKLGLSVVPVDYQDFASEAEEQAYLIADNRIAELADIDNAALKELLAKLEAEGVDMDLTGFDAEALKQLSATPDAITIDDKSGSNDSESQSQKCYCPKCGFAFEVEL